MRKPAKLVELIDKLDEDLVEGESDLSLGTDASAIITLKSGEEIKLDEFDIARLFQNQKTVEQLFESIGHPEGASIEFIDTIIPTEVVDFLQEIFANVEER
jgi:hypothetical protein